jgi:amino acid adenylation domain-containing protein
MTQQTSRSYRSSNQQKRHWSLLQNGIDCRAQYAVWLEGSLDRERLHRAITRVVSRHEILRSTFQQPSGLKVPVQIVGDENRLVWREIDVDSGHGPLRDVLTALFEEHRREPLPLDGISPLRFTLGRAADTAHVLFVTASSLVSDLESLHQVVDETMRSYSSDARLEESAEPLQYASFAAWQAEVCEDEEATLGRKYWRSQDLNSVLRVEHPLARISGDSSTFEIDRVELSLPVDVIAGLDDFSRRSGKSESLLHFACWRGLLGRITGVDDLSIAYRVTGRTDEELEAAVGPFASVVPLRCQAAEGSSYHAIADKISHILERAGEWEPYFSWEDAIDAAAGVESTFLPFAFEFLTHPTGGEASGVRFTPIRQFECLDRFHLKLSCSRQGSSVAAEIHYAPEVFSRDDVVRLAHQYEAMLRAVIGSPTADLAAMEVLGPEERTSTLEELNDTRMQFDAELCVHTMFEAQAAICPDRCAVVHEDGALSYGALDRRANALAARLQSMGVGPGATVGLLTDRSLDTIVAILAILKAGGAYVPLDASMPRKRLEMIVHESHASAVVVHRALAEIVHEANVNLVILDETLQSGEQRPEPPAAMVTPSDLAYVIFTSGTTGVPKGVSVEHRQLVNYVCGLAARLNVADGEHMATVSTFAADLGNTVIYTALTTGGTLHVTTERRRTDPDALADYFARWRIDCLKIVPSHLNALLSASAPQHVLSCRRIVLGGETTTWQLIDRIAALSPSCEVFNHYGPTETTVGATTYSLSRQGRDPHSATLPIGRPLPNYRVYVIGSGGTPEPIGVSGELYIGGAGVGRGYLNRPAETADRFVPDWFSEAGQRLYRTGDRVRFVPSGHVEFHGRVDDQIKIRGYRVEQGEIEAVLAACPSVRQAVVLAKVGPTGAMRLIAYLVLKHRDATLEEIRRFAEGYLPDYMVPSAFITLPSLPLNRNGKVDRQALPAPDITAVQESAVAPCTAVERTLAEIWSDLLGVDGIGVRDNFFDRGGHSLSAMQLVSRIRRHFDVELPLLSIFEAPTIEGIAAKIEQSSEQPSRPGLPPIEAAGRRDRTVPASFSQERLWLFDQLQPGNSAYNVPAAVRIGGVLDVAALEQTFTAVVNRHDVLRTTFSSIDGRPVQVIGPPWAAGLAVTDLRGLRAPERMRCVEAVARAHAQRPFDLAKGPVWRATLLRVAPDEHVLLWNQHHISSDGWSAAIFARELSQLYAAFAGGEPHSLAPLTIQYADFSEWQRAWLDGEGKATQTAYWRDRLSDAPASLALPIDRPHPAVPSFRGGSELVVLTPELSRALVALGRRQGATLYMTLLSALNALLYLHTGQTDMIVGSPTAGRSHGQTENLIGFFLNTLALRTKVKGDASFAQLLQDVRAGVLDAFANQDLPFDHIVDALRIERDRSRSVLYQVLFNYQRVSEARLALSDLRLTPLESPTVGSKFDLTLYATEGTEQIALRMVYNRDIFEAATVAVMLARFVVLLEAIVKDPGCQVSSLPLLMEHERTHQYAPAKPPKYPPAFTRFESDALSSTIDDRFERQVAMYPDHIAVKTSRYAWTYRQLDSEATTIAGRIEALVGGSSTRVGVLFESGAPLMAAILGTLKAGQTYVPLDPSNPRDRLAYMVRHSEAAVLLTDTAHLTLARELAGDSVPVVNGEAATIAPPFAGLRRASPDSVAYILYTSGSTGVPKGVVQSHRNLLHFMRVYTNNLGIHHGDRLSLLSSYGFDGAVMDIFGALLNGATLVPANLAIDGLDGALARIGDGRVTVFHSTPTVFRQLFGSASQNGELEHVRAVVLGGEEALRSDLELFKVRFPREAVLINGLGPSESTVTLQHYMDHDTINTRTSLPVGLPVEDTEILLLDESGGATPVYGEIAIRSPHVALGYWRDDAKTAAAFTSEPDDARRRVYRTGDIGRRLADGTLEFVGRKDTQVKIRGFRIELGEVESVLGQHPVVQECAVLARADDGGAARLVAYVRPSTFRADVATELRHFLKQKLPDYMIPTAFVVQTSLPVTANGKLDRNALPKVEVKTEAEVEFIAPRTAVERRIAELWKEILGISRIGVLDDFFAVGGQSLLAMRLISRIRSSFEVELALRLIFESPTLEGMAGHVEAALRSDGGNRRRLPAIEPASRDGRMPLSFAQQRMWILDQLEPGAATYNVPAAVELSGPLQPSALEQAIDAIIRRHEVLRTTFRKSDQGEPEQVISAPSHQGVPVVDLSGLSSDNIEHTLDRLAQEEARYPFDLNIGPLFRITLLRVTDFRHVVLFTMHHIVSDGWSTGVLIRELSELYQALVAGRGYALPPLPIQYADYAVWQRRWLDSNVLQEQVEYWKRQLDGIPEQLALPLDRPRGADVTYSGAREPFSIQAQFVAPLASLARDEGTTLFVALLAVFKVLLHRYTGQHDIVVGAPIAGRNTDETEPLIGFFVNTLVLRSRVDPTGSFRNLLRQVHETVLNATANQDLPFERLVDELSPTRGAGHTPLFQVAFVLQNAPREALMMSDLTLRTRPLETRTSKFDWSISLTEVAEGLAGTFENNTDLFDRATIQRVVHDYQHLIAEAVANPDQVIADLEVMDSASRHRVLVEWNDTVREYPREASIPALVEERVAQTPDAVAVVDGVTHLTYRELNDRANRLARHLRRRGLRPETKVGLYLERSPEFIVAVLATLKSGGVYAPLDTAYPEDRIRVMAEDAGIDTVLTVRPLAERVAGIGAACILLDAAWSDIARESGENLGVPVLAEQLAYVVYTSGSTGKPKGIAVPHRAVIRLVRNTNYVDLGRGDILAHASNTSFDAATLELWGALLQGGALAVIAADTVVSPKGYSAALRRHRVTTLFVTSALFNRMIADNPHSFETQQTVLVGGDAVDPASMRRALINPSPVRYLNGYGPTENTTFSSWYHITEVEERAHTVPIGRPIGNSRMIVLDASRRLVPLGASGELYVGGDGLARGYVQRPDLTAERFVPDPYPIQPGSRLYRTGDVVKQDPDGNAVFQGRADHQVKIRGFRIELGEIETTIAAEDGVRDAVVLAREDVPGDRRLVAYLVVDPLRRPSTSDLRSALRNRLPDYMVPAAFVMLDALPLTPNGKVDRRALPAPGEVGGGNRVWKDASRGPSRPTTDAEVAVARIWKSILGLDDVGLDDKFFDLGGHSLNAIQVVTRIERELACQIKFNDLIFQTLRQVAAACETQLAK